MQEQLYRQKKNRLVAGVFAGFADKFGVDLPLIRVLYIAFSIILLPVGICLYLLLATYLPDKDTLDRQFNGLGSRRLKKAEKIK